MIQPTPPEIPRRFTVIVGIVDPAHPTLPVEHFDAVRQAINEIIPTLLANMGINASPLKLELGRDDQYHYLDVVLAEAEPISERGLFEELEPSGGLPADVAHALAAEVRALLYTLMKEGNVSIGELCEATATLRKRMSVPIRVANVIRKAPGSHLVLQAHGVQHELDLGVLGGVVESDQAITASAHVRAVGPRAAFLERIRFATVPPALKLPRSGWLTLSRNTLPEIVDALEKACREERRLSLNLRLWIHRVHRTVRAMHPATTITPDGQVLGAR